MRSGTSFVKQSTTSMFQVSSTVAFLAMIYPYQVHVAADLVTQGSPTYLWSRRSTADTLLREPVDVAVNDSGQVLVTDIQRRALIILDGTNGKPLGIVGSGDHAESVFVVPYLVAVSPNGNLIGVYDIGRRSVDVLDRHFALIRRVYTDFVIVYPKDMVIRNDTTVIIAGGSMIASDEARGLHRFDPSSDTSYSMGPSIRGDGPSRAKQFIAGGALYDQGSSDLVFADAGTGTVWRVSNEGSRRVTRLLRETKSLLKQVVGTGGGATRQQSRIWWTFPRALLVRPVKRSTAYLVMWSEVDRGLTRFYETRSSGSQEVGIWWVGVRSATWFDDDSAIVVTQGANDGWTVGRVALPQ